MHKHVEISVVTPCFNEEENILNCVNELRDAMKKFLPKVSYEHICVDNNSTDSTFQKLLDISAKDKKVKVIRNSRNVGALYNSWIGMQNCNGNYIVPALVADLQDPPTLIPQMYEELKRKEVLVVYAVMSDRQDNFKFMRKVFYKFIKKFAYTDLPKNTTEFLMADRRVIQSVLDTNDYYPYTRGLVGLTSVASSSLYYTRKARARGKSHENFSTLINHAFNAFISTSALLPKFLTLSGIIISLVSLSFATYNFIGFLFFPDQIVSRGVPTLLIAIFFLSGINFLFLGLLSEYIHATYRQVRQSPKSFITHKINF